MYGNMNVMVIIQRIIQCKLEVILTLQMLEDMTLEIMFLLERAEQDTSFQMSVDINMSAPLCAVKERGECLRLEFYT